MLDTGTGIDPHLSDLVLRELGCGLPTAPSRSLVSDRVRCVLCTGSPTEVTGVEAVAITTEVRCLGFRERGGSVRHLTREAVCVAEGLVSQKLAVTSPVCRVRPQDALIRFLCLHLKEDFVGLAVRRSHRCSVADC